MLFSASTSAAVPRAPCAFNTSSACCATSSEAWYCGTFAASNCCVGAADTLCYALDMKLGGGTVDKLLALRYGYNYLRSTRTKATLSCLPSCSRGVSLIA